MTQSQPDGVRLIDILPSRLSSASTLYSEHAFQEFPHDDLKVLLPLHEPSDTQTDHLSFIPQSLPSLSASSFNYPPHKRRNTSFCQSDRRSSNAELSSIPSVDFDSEDRQQRERRACSLDRGRAAYSASWKTETFERGPAILEGEEILQTDPGHTASLWQKVNMSATNQPSLPGYSKPTASYTAKSRTSNTSESKRSKPPSPYDADFQERVLEPRGITFAMATLIGAHDHFATELVEANVAEHYQQKAPLVSVWLRRDAQFVADIKREYTCMVHNQLCETEFASYAREALLNRDPRSLDVTSQRGWKTERMLELYAKPQKLIKKTWEAPPIMHPPEAAAVKGWTDYAFDIRPDCSYWLSLQVFNPVYVANIQTHVHVINQRITCPYLTIEFKRNDSEEEVAECQVAAASSVALYNRFCLREKALRATNKPWTTRRTEAVRHYGLTLKGNTYHVWVIQPRLTEDFKWAGCEMKHIYEGFLTIEASIIDFIDWVNEIHCWGLTVFGPKCEDDVKLCIDPTQAKGRVSENRPESDSSSDEKRGRS